MEDMPRQPRGFYDKEEFCQDRLLEYIEGRRRRLNKKQSDLGEAVGMSQQSFSYRMHRDKGRGNFEFIHLVKLFKELEATDEEILKLMKM